MTETGDLKRTCLQETFVQLMWFVVISMIKINLNVECVDEVCEDKFR